MDTLLFYLRSKNWDEIGKPTNDDLRRTDSRSLLRTNAPSNQPTDPSLHRGQGGKTNIKRRKEKYQNYQNGDFYIDLASRRRRNRREENGGVIQLTNQKKWFAKRNLSLVRQIFVICKFNAVL